jgi:Fic family protein
MDISRFTDKAPGMLVTLANTTHFLPAPLPPEWEVPGTLWPLVVEANRQLAVLEGIGRYLPNPEILLRPLEDREAIQSSRIEGTYATAREYLLFELSPREPTSEEDRANDWLEVHNYRRALESAVASDLPVSLRLIKDMHRILLGGVRGRDRAPGEFRRISVAIGTKANPRFIPPPASEVAGCLDQLEKYIHQEPRRFDPLVECFLVHYQFETIHPFLDGNGRVGRLLLVLMIQRLTGLTKPWLYMSQYFEKHRDEYVDCLFNVSAVGDWSGWIKFCLEGTVQQCKDTVTRCERLLGIKADFVNRLVSLRGGSQRLNQVVEMIFDSPFVGVADLAKRLNVYYQTAQKDINRLVDLKILRELPNHHPKTYFSPEVFSVAYEDLGTPEQ